MAAAPAAAPPPQGPFAVCVTGAAGFVGSHVVQLLLADARVARVHATVSSLVRSHTAHLTAMAAAAGDPARLVLLEADLEAADHGASAFSAALRGCDAAVHAASPYDLSRPQDEQLGPSVLGTEAAVRAALACPTLRRLVLTSSAAAAYGRRLPADHVYSEADFSEEEFLTASKNWYALGKLRAELRAWELVLSERGGLTMAAVCPTQCLGPALHLPKGSGKPLNQSLALLAEFCDGSKTTVPAKGKCLVDVREVAAAHVLALGLGTGLRTAATVTAASGAQLKAERYLLVAGSLPWRYIAEVLREALPYARVPTAVEAGPPSLPQAICSLRATHVLGVRHRPMEEAIIDAARSIAESGHLAKPQMVARCAPPLLTDPVARLLELSATAQAAGRRRVIVGIAGVPGAGKSTLAAELRKGAVAALTAAEVASLRAAAGGAVGAGAEAECAARAESAVVVLGLDGFHLTRAQLAAMPNAAEALALRGAPWTFSAEDAASRLAAVRGASADANVAWPSFDHAVKDPVENDIVCAASARIVILEGLYVLHPLDGFGALRPLLDAAWYLDTPRAESRTRLALRHMAAWGMSLAEADARIDENDGPNSNVVERSRVLANGLVLSSAR